MEHPPIYLRVNGQNSGPFTRDQIEAKRSAHEIDDNTLWWSEGMADWKAWNELPTPPPVLSDRPDNLESKKVCTNRRRWLLRTLTALLICIPLACAIPFLHFIYAHNLEIARQENQVQAACSAVVAWQRNSENILAEIKKAGNHPSPTHLWEIGQELIQNGTEGTNAIAQTQAIMPLINLGITNEWDANTRQRLKQVRTILTTRGAAIRSRAQQQIREGQTFQTEAIKQKILRGMHRLKAWYQNHPNPIGELTGIHNLTAAQKEAAGKNLIHNGQKEEEIIDEIRKNAEKLPSKLRAAMMNHIEKWQQNAKNEISLGNKITKKWNPSNTTL